MTLQALLLIAAAVASPAPWHPPDEPVAERIRTRVAVVGGEPLNERVALGGFYARRSFRPAWSNEHGPNRLADDLVDVLGRADLEGLNPEEYHLAEIRALLTAVRDDASSGRSTDPDRLAQLDLLLTDAFLLYGSHLLAPATRAELNVSAATRAEQLRLNLERWRWLPQDLGRRRIIVNIAAYELAVIEDEEVVLAMRVVVGKRYRRTPVFSDTVRYIVLNPSWYVPRNIAVQDLLPKIQHDPSYLERLQMHVFEGSAPIDPATVDWSAVTADNFPYRINQEPGRLNALGRIKFAFPNPYDVYLHDTPSRELFDEAQRDFSSGCIRLEKPVDLAVYLMKKDRRWNREALERALDDGTERAVYLPRPMPVHLLYWTAWADEDGTIQFRADIHGLDQPLADALQAPLPSKD